MICIDVDAMVKLAHWRILDELPNIVGLPWHDCATLFSLGFRAKRSLNSPDKKLFHSEAAATTVYEVTQRMSQLNQEIDESLLAELESARGIDAGEAVLLSNVIHGENNKLITGDKRAIHALSKLPLKDHFFGKIIILEQVILASLIQHGDKWLLERICPYRDLDISVKISLGSQCNSVDREIRKALASYINEIDVLCHPSLLSPLNTNPLS